MKPELIEIQPIDMCTLLPLEVEYPGDCLTLGNLTPEELRNINCPFKIIPEDSQLILSHDVSSGDHFFNLYIAEGNDGLPIGFPFSTEEQGRKLFGYTIKPSGVIFQYINYGNSGKSRQRVVNNTSYEWDLTEMCRILLNRDGEWEKKTHVSQF